MISFALALSLTLATLSSAAKLANPPGKTIVAHNSTTSTGSGVRYHHFDCGTDSSHATQDLKQTLHVLYQNDLTKRRAKRLIRAAERGITLPRETEDVKDIDYNNIDYIDAQLLYDDVDDEDYDPEEQDAQDYNTTSHSGPISGRAIKAQPSTIYINTYFHIVSTPQNAGLVTTDMVTAQITAMNAAYNVHGIAFQLRGTDNTTNSDWAQSASSDSDGAMKSALRQGTYQDLNLYFQTDMAGGILGRCTLPTSVGTNADPSSYTTDGCNIAAGTMPGGPIYGYNAGMTAVHETGHWLGLLHTFEGYSCTGTGDYIADTPAEATSTDGCPTNPFKNSCKGIRKGVDPIHNYMDYSTDACYNRFTKGQESRMRTLWAQFRIGK